MARVRARVGKSHEAQVREALEHERRAFRQQWDALAAQWARQWDALAAQWAGVEELYEVQRKGVMELLNASAILVEEEECLRCRQPKGQPHLTSTCRDAARIKLIRQFVAGWVSDPEQHEAAEREETAEREAAGQGQGEDERVTA